MCREVIRSERAGLGRPRSHGVKDCVQSWSQRDWSVGSVSKWVRRRARSSWGAASAVIMVVVGINLRGERERCWSSCWRRERDMELG